MASHNRRRGGERHRHLLDGVLLVVAVAVLLLVVMSAASPSASGKQLDEPPDLPDRDRIACSAAPQKCLIGTAAVMSVDFPWWKLGYKVEVVEPRDDWTHGQVMHAERRIELFVSDEMTVLHVAAIFAHEVGHVLGHSCEVDTLTVWRERRGIPDDVPTYTPPPHHFDSVSEDFAEAFAQYLGFGPSRSTVATPPTGAWLNANADLFDPARCQQR
jgi:hypothetical protein